MTAPSDRMSAREALTVGFAASAWVVVAAAGVLFLLADNQGDDWNALGYGLLFLLAAGVGTLLGLITAACLLVCVLSGEALLVRSWVVAGIPAVAAVGTTLYAVSG